MANSSKRPIVVFPINQLKAIGKFLLALRGIILNIGNNVGYFATPDPTLLQGTTAADNLEAAETTAKTRVRGSAAARDLVYDISLDVVHGYQGYVQKQADNAPDEATAIAIIQSSGFGLKLQGVRVKAPLAAKNGDVTGLVLLYAKSAGKRVSYEWQDSADGLLWTNLPSTLQAKTKVNGLDTLKTRYFRVRVVDKNGVGNWSAIVSIIVM